MSVSTNQRTRKKQTNKLIVLSVILIIVCVVIGTLLFFRFKATTKDTAISVFANALEETRKTTYNQFKNKAFNYFEKKNHVSNRATLTIGNIKEENSLEVLSVSDSWVKIHEPEKDDRTRRWVEFHATGVYTVDMSMSEFIIDDYNNFVLVKLRTPQLSHVAVDNDTKMYTLSYEKGLGEWDGTYDQGIRLMKEDRAEAKRELTKQLSNNNTNLAKAKESAEHLIRAFIKNVNPELNLKDSSIQIEFT